MSQPLYLEDLSVGQRFISASCTLDAAQIKRYAAEYDPQPFHLDDAAAAHSFFRGLAASGWHVVGVTMRLLVDGGLPIAGGIIGAGAEVTWPKPTRPGDVLQATSEILDIQPSKSKPDRGIATVRTETRNQSGDVLLGLKVKILVFRRSGTR
jgi:acyl dehydratase